MDDQPEMEMGEPIFCFSHVLEQAETKMTKIP